MFSKSYADIKPVTDGSGMAENRFFIITQICFRGKWVKRFGLGGQDGQGPGEFYPIVL